MVAQHHRSSGRHVVHAVAELVGRRGTGRIDAPDLFQPGAVDEITQPQQGQAAKKQMESKYGKERAALEKQGEALKKAAEELKGPKASDEKKLAFIRKKQELDQKTRNFLRKVEQDEVKLRQDMVTLVFNATYNVAQRKGFNFVVDITAGGVLYADQTMDLTQDVLAEVNKMHKDEKAKASK